MVRGAKLVELLQRCNAELRAKTSMKLDERKEAFRHLLYSKKADFVDFRQGPLPVSVAPEVMAYNLLHEKASVFSSACMPLYIRLETRDERGYIDFMFKAGDDLRQDQLVMQVIKLCDDLLKRENVDLELVTYRCLATALQDGIVEFVPDSMTLYDIQKEYGGIIQYLQNKRPDPANRAQIDPLVMDRFVKSTAGQSHTSLMKFKL